MPGVERRGLQAQGGDRVRDLERASQHRAVGEFGAEVDDTGGSAERVPEPWNLIDDKITDWAIVSHARRVGGDKNVDDEIGAVCLSNESIAARAPVSESIKLSR
jgi:hypothetical protein